jgi:hypothetical protein
MQVRNLLITETKQKRSFDIFLCFPLFVDMGGVCEERFEGLKYQQGANIRYKRVEASNSCARTLIFGSFSFIAFLSKFFLFIHPFSLFFGLVFYCLFSFFSLVFYRPSFSPLFYPCFSAHVVSSLAYHNLLETKWLGCCCCFLYLLMCLL